MTSRRAAAAESKASASSCSRRCGSAGAEKTMTLRGSPAMAASVPAASGEEVFLARAQEGLRTGAVVLRDVALEAADDDGGLARVLVAHEVGGGRRLVGDGDPCRAQL